MFIQKSIRKILDKIYKPLILNYTKKERKYRYGSLNLIVRPGIFHPRFFNSTNNILNFMQKTDIEGKNILDLGTGSGILALYAAQRGAKVTASDINPQAIENTIYNSKLNSLSINIIQSDLFDNIKSQKYDIIVINPPYYPKNPQKEDDYAWYCGEKFEYYHKLFKQIPPYLYGNSLPVLSLADTCDIKTIKDIATMYGYRLELIEQKRYLWEIQYIFIIVKNSAGNTYNI
jgi:release factor glutamine methyltransferase